MLVGDGRPYYRTNADMRLWSLWIVVTMLLLAVVAGCLPIGWEKTGDPVAEVVYVNHLDEPVQIAYEMWVTLKETDRYRRDGPEVPAEGSANAHLMMGYARIRVQGTTVSSKRIVLDRSISDEDLKSPSPLKIEIQ